MDKKLLFIFLGMFLLIGIIGSVNASVWDDGLVSYYKLDETSGNLTDELGINNGNFTNGTYSATGKINTAIDYDGSSYSTTSSGTGFPIGNSNRTMCVWVYPKSNTEAVLFGWGYDGPTNQSLLRRNSTGGFWFNGYGEDIHTPLNYPINDWYDVCFSYNGVTGNLYVNGLSVKNSSIYLSTRQSELFISRYTSVNANRFNGIIDEIGIWNRTLNANEISDLYNNGNGLPYGGIDLRYYSTLISPSNGTITTSSSQSFSTIFNITGTNTGNYTWKNTTYYVWYENGTLFNSTSVILPESNSTEYTLNISEFEVGNYLWNINSYYGNITYDNSTWSSNGNFSLVVGASLSSLTYRNSTFETSTESFSAMFNILPSAEISLAQLVYNGTNYTITNLTNSGGNLTIQKTIDIPVNVNPLANETKTFKFRFTYGGGSVQETDEYSQNVSFINLVQCGGSYTTQAINFTLYNEINQTKINGVLNPINFESNWNYWLGSGNIYKNYSFQNLTSSLNNYQFCMFPYLPNNYTFKTNTEVKFSAIDFRENSYYLRNATLDNVSENILLYLVHSDYATKFFLTFQYGNTLLKNAYVTVQKYFTGLGGYNTVAILTTDNDGQTTMWQEVDKDYKYSIVQDGSLIGIIERTSICSVAPCSMNLILYGSIGSGFDAFYDIYAQNILSNLSYNPSTKIVTYSFIDTTGLANYFRMEVKKTKIDDSPSLICNEISYSSAGTLNCNMTGYDGDFIVNTYISRSPEKVDKIIAFVISEDLIASLGLNGVLIILILIVTLVIAAAVMSRGNPSVVIFVFGFALLGLRIIGILPFSWITVGALEVLIIWIMIKLKT